ncbi:MAG: toll/interleukin-1 receptor domain-containing protein [Pyrinomonadaceae bacterium]
MSNVFISYARRDRKTAEKFARAFESQHWDVFWDPKIPAGKTWRQVITENLARAQCVVVLWSATSITSDWVLDEATVGRKRNVLVPVFIEANVEPPLGFGGVQAADLSAWDGTTENALVQKLLVDISAIFPPASDGEQDAIRAKQIEETLHRRQQFRTRYTILAITLGGGLGAGVGLFLLRAIVGLTLMDFEGYGLSVALAFLYNAAILGGTLSFGIALAGQLWKAGDDRHQNNISWIRIFQRREILVMILGTLLFAASHTIMAIVNGLPAFKVETIRSILAASVAGLALSIALRDQPEARLRLKFASWCRRIAIVMLTFAAVQLPFSFKRAAGTGLTLIGGADFYRDHFTFWTTVPANLRTPSYLAEIDAALVGTIFFIGIVFGMARAANLLSKWLKLIDLE